MLVTLGNTEKAAEYQRLVEKHKTACIRYPSLSFD